MDIIKDVKAVCRIYFAKAKDVSSITKNEDNKATVYFNTGTWELLDVPVTSINLTDNMDNVDAGDKHPKTLRVTYPNDTNLTRETFSVLKSYPLIIRADFTDGTSQLFGNLDNPCWMQYDYSSKGYTTKRELTFSVTALEEALYLDETVIS